MQIDGKTQVVGIVADPITHVRTPQLFNALMVRQGVNAVCVPLHVSVPQLSQLLQGVAAAQNLRGVVVTIPHKESVIGLCGALTSSARLIGAANVLRWDRSQGHWLGGNLDGDGFVAGVKAHAHVLTGKRVLMVGAGGAGKAIAYAVARENPAELVISNRSVARAEEVVDRVRSAVPEVAIRTGIANATGFDVVINATSLGLRDEDPSSLPVETLEVGTLVCEAVMRDTDTALLEGARQRGCLIHEGQHMLHGQLVEMAKFFGLSQKPTELPLGR